MNNSKFVLISESGYSKEHNKLLLSLLEKEYELFCVVGEDCMLWEEIMDELAVGDGTNPRCIITTSHPDETVEEVIEFAETFGTNKASGVDVVHI